MARVSVSSMLSALVELGRHYLDRPGQSGSVASIVEQCRDLVSARGEASGTALASEIVERCEALDEDKSLELLIELNRAFSLDEKVLQAAARAYADEPSNEAYLTLSAATEAPRQELFRRLNMAPSGTESIVKMRARLLAALAGHPQLAPLERDLKLLLSSWFNRGFLMFEQIDWRTPAVILEKLIQYEAVHEIAGWDDLRRRLEADRRCFAFFHPALPDEPLIFVQVALTNGLAGQIQDLLAESPKYGKDGRADTAIFYSISNCQEGLAGISFGNFLIKQVVDAVQRELPHVKRFATLSPIPGFRKWLDHKLMCETPEFLTEDELELLHLSGWRKNDVMRQQLKAALMRLCAIYLIEEKRKSRPLDSVARFHLGNGASIERLHWMADLSDKGLDQSVGMMVNYLYDSHEIVSNHEAYVREGKIAVSSAVARLASGRP